MPESTRTRRPRKAADRPAKPYRDFPLYPHPLGYWAKKILGRIHYFGRWGRVVGGKLTRVEGDGWKDALELYKVQREDLYAGRTPRAAGGGLTVADLCNRFLTAKHDLVSAGELGPRMFAEYKATTDLLVAAFGANRLVDDLVAGDFQSLRAQMATRWGPVRLGNSITRVKSVFKFGYDNGLLEKAVRYGSEFKKPGKATMRKHRVAAGAKMFEAGEVRAMVKGALVPGEDGPRLVQADPSLKAMILLGINCGFGNTDVATLPLSRVDLDRGWIDFPRPKTGIERRCPLWPETMEAIRAVVEARLSDSTKPAGPDGLGRVFLNAIGRPMVRHAGSNRRDNVGVAFSRLLQKLGINGRSGLGFYTLRHTFRTVADGARDPVAVDLIMGHADHSMGANYRARVEDDRLRAVTDHVRNWLFGEER